MPDVETTSGCLIYAAAILVGIAILVSVTVFAVWVFLNS